MQAPLPGSNHPHHWNFKYDLDGLEIKFFLSVQKWKNKIIALGAPETLSTLAAHFSDAEVEVQLCVGVPQFPTVFTVPIDLFLAVMGIHRATRRKHAPISVSHLLIGDM